MILQFESGKNNGGFLLWSDYSQLKPLHTFAMALSKQSTVLEYEGLLPAFAYDLRKAYESQREIEKRKVWDDEITIYGVEQVWPTFILQVALFRTGISFVDSTKLDQSHVFLLEYFLENAIRTTFPKEAEQILFNYRRLIGNQESDYTTELVGSRVAYFLFQSPSRRKNLLAEILASLDPAWTRYHAATTSNTLSPSDFDGYSWDSLDDARNFGKVI